MAALLRDISLAGQLMLHDNASRCGKPERGACRRRRVGQMKPGYSAPYCVAGVELCRLPWRQFEVGVDDGANELSWWSMFSASISVRARSR